MKGIKKYYLEFLLLFVWSLVMRTLGTCANIMVGGMQMAIHILLGISHIPQIIRFVKERGAKVLNTVLFVVIMVHGDLKKQQYVKQARDIRCKMVNA